MKILKQVTIKGLVYNLLQVDSTTIRRQLLNPQPVLESENSATPSIVEHTVEEKPVKKTVKRKTLSTKKKTTKKAK